MIGSLCLDDIRWSHCSIIFGNRVVVALLNRVVALLNRVVGGCIAQQVDH